MCPCPYLLSVILGSEQDAPEKGKYNSAVERLSASSELPPVIRTAFELRTVVVVVVAVVVVVVVVVVFTVVVVFKVVDFLLDALVRGKIPKALRSTTLIKPDLTWEPGFSLDHDICRVEYQPDLSCHTILF